MSVEELISKLQDMPRNSEVCLDWCNIESFEITSIEKGIGEDANGYTIPLVVIKITKS